MSETELYIRYLPFYYRQMKYNVEVSRWVFFFSVFNIDFASYTKNVLGDELDLV